MVGFIMNTVCTLFCWVVDVDVDFLAYGLRKRAFSPIIAGWSEIPRGKFLRFVCLVRTYLPHDRGVRVLH